MNFKIVILISLCILKTINTTKHRPKITTSEGHLIIEVATHKNITFKTDGFGRVNVNEIDITKAAEISHSALEAMRKYKTNFEASFEKISKFGEILEANGEFLNGNFKGNYSLNTQGQIPVNVDSLVRSVRNLNRRVNTLRRKIRIMQNLLISNECAGDPCKNGGTCVDLYGAFLCHCPPEWEGATCEKDVNECARFAGTDLGCQNGATCTNRPGSYECLCSHGWFGLHCTRRSTDCNSGSSSELCGHGTCVNQNNDLGYKCICDQGWTTDGKSAACNVDVNECLMNKPSCSVNPPVECINLPGTFHCGACPPGFSGNGYYCTDIDECADSNGGCSTNPLVQCINTHGSRICGNCPPGYIGNGVVCSYQGGVCGVNNGGCHPLATCRDNQRISSTYVECICPAGYIGNGIGPAGCTPSAHFSSNPCLANPCVHGTCQNLNGTGNYVCNCLRRYTGRNCDQLKDLCSSNPCENGGTCDSILGVRYRCTCPKGYIGFRCEMEQQACGGRLRTESGTLSYPSLISKTYGHSVSCAWTIETNTSQVLNITFTRFKVEASHNCQFDWLQIHDGKNTLAKSLGRFCGSDLPHNGTIISTHNIIYLWFRADSSIADTGFELAWNSIDPICGETVSSVTSHGTIQSPGSPGYYPNNRDCYWSLAVQPGKRLLFHFFTLMIGDDSNCDHDYLEFFSGQSVEDPVFAKFCNTSRPSPLTSHGSEVLIHFHSDESKSYPGFQITYSVVEGIPGCGGVFTTEQGEIRSPSFNGAYPTDLLCEYKIKLPEKSRVSLNFLSFSVENSDSCQFDSVSIFAGDNSDSPLIGRYCGTDIPPPYFSENNEILVVFKTDWSTGGEGFVLRYQAICGGRFTSASGIIQSPSYPLYYPNSRTCIYEIVQPLGTAIKLQVTDLDIEQNSAPDCLYDFIEIRDGDTSNSTLIGRYCQKPPPTIFSTYNHLWIEFRTDSYVGSRGFQANYTTTQTGCGGILKDKRHTISSTDFPPLLDCRWVISAPPSKVIQIVWINLHIEQSTSCVNSYLEIFDNNTENSMGGSIGKFCGQNLPPMILSSSNIVTLVYHIEHTETSNEFVLTYSTIDEKNVCGGNYFTNAGIIKSPNYPNNYPTALDCSWVITVNPGNQIMLNVTDFSVEFFSNCRYDYVEIRNGGTSSSPLVGKYCGDKIPKLIPSHTNKMFIYFKSDTSKPGKGFRITWDTTATGCGGSLTSPTGSIISPSYPEPYNENAECIWRISVSAGSFVQVVFADLELEQHSHCELDYVELFDGPSVQSKSLGRFCEHSPPFVKSTGNHMSVKFRSDLTQQGRGFNLQYSTMCNNTVKGFRGIIESPNFPNEYHGQLNCNWDIEVSAFNRINISFSHFQLERVAYNYNTSEPECIYDYVEVLYAEHHEVYEELSFQKYGRYCGNEKPPLMALNGDKAKIHFVSDSLIFGIGFRLEWQIDGCGGFLKGPEGTILTPNYPKKYPASIECNWSIEVEYGRNIEITFNEVDTERDYSCEYDYIKIYNGEDDSYPQIAHICHQSKPTVVASTANFMFVSFKADSSYQGRGFNATYTTKETKCGGRFTAEKGAITSPNYPQNFDKNDTCGYLIEIHEGFLVNLKFEDFDLPELSGVACKDNNESYVSVHDGPSPAYPVLTKVCGKSFTNETFISTYNMMFVEFFGLGEWTAKGFMAHYEEACGARIETASTGSISLEFTDHGYEEMNCTWTIVSKEPTKHVSLVFSSLHTLYNCDISDNTVKVYNGESSDAPILLSYCGSKIPPMITSDGSALHVVVKSNAEFFAIYSVYDSFCGGTLTAADGFFTSPGYPKKYPSNVECEWTLQIPEGNTVSLSFSEFGLQETEHCNTDFLEIRQKNSHGKLLGVFCGDNSPTSITNIGSIWILLKTSSLEEDGDKSPRGFSAEYILSEQNELSGLFGVIENPRQVLLDFKEFVYKITVEFGKRILLTFKELYVEEMGFEDYCVSSVNVFDGPDDESPTLGQFCGTTLPKPIKSKLNALTIKVTLYASQKFANRFLLEWLQIDNRFENLDPNKKKPKKCASPEPIDLYALKNSTTITSPGYPNGYENNLNCEWTFTTIPMNHIEVYFKDVNLERFAFTMGRCVSDYVEIFRKGDTGDWESMRKICRDNETFTSIAAPNLMKLSFTSNVHFNGTGFSALVREDCGGALAGPEGDIIYNNETLRHYSYYRYKNIYFKECQWNVTVGAGKTIEVTLLKMNILNENDKCKNYVILRNGHFPDSPILGNKKHCTSELATQVLKTTGNTLYVKYSGITIAADFKIHYKEVGYECGGEIILDKYPDSTEITTPNYPNIPPPHIECIWIIAGPAVELLRIDFLERFDLASGKDCENEFVEVRDGGTVLSPLIGKYCGKPPSSQFTTANMMFVRYFSQLSEPSNGFKAKIALDDCGGTIRAKTGRVQSKNFNNPSKYPVDVNCTWHLIVPSGHTMKLEFAKLDLLPASTNCSNSDHVKLLEYNKATGEFSVLGLYCDQAPPSIESSSNEVIVNFVTGKHQHQASGFSLKFNSTAQTCGGTVELSQGFIQSPNYPRQHEGHRSCAWTIKVPIGRRVTLEILDSDFEGRAAYLNGLAIYNGPGFKGYIAIIPSYDNDKKIFESTGNTMLVYYWSRSAVPNRGFKAQFSSNKPTKCRGDFNTDNGILKQPYPPLNSYYCNYFRDKSNDGTLVLTLTSVSNTTLKTPRVCQYASSQIAFTTQDESAIYNEICWDVTNFQIRSPYPLNRVITLQQNYWLYANYTISYTNYQCGGLVAGETGTITSPNYPSKPSQSFECAWLLRLPEEQTIQVTFNDLDLGDSCEKSFVDIYNGKSPLSPKINRFCQKNKPEPFKSQTNNLWIEYKFDSKEAPGGKGFSIKYEPIIRGCGGVFHDKTRVIQTPNYPKDYPDNSECLWELHSAEGYHIGLTFTARFQLEESDSCSNDFVEIWDWKDNDWVSLGRKCGRDISRVFNSTSNKMKILFRSNDKISGSGFKAQWVWNCGGTFVADTKERFIVSPGFPQQYSPNMFCQYNITAPQRQYINLHFYDLAIEKHSSQCKYDNLTISNFPNGINYEHRFYQPKHVFCGIDNPPDIRMVGNIYITFKSDKFLQRSGFKFSYALDDCGGTINTPRSIETPNFNVTRIAGLYSGFLSCIWNITAPPNKAILLQFERFHFTRRSRCYFDNVEIYEGTSTNLPNRKANLCGDLNEDLPEIRSKGNNMIVKLRTDKSMNQGGFKASIYFVHSEKEGCGGTLNITKETELTAPNLGAMDCSWSIFGNVGGVIKVKFSKLDLPDTCTFASNGTIFKNCSCGFVEIKDGASSLADRIEKICGIQVSDIKREIISSTHAVTIRLNLVTPVTQAFKIVLTPIQSICGPLYLNVTKEKQVLTSPNYPNTYPSNFRCTWIFRSTNKIVLHFEDIDLLETSSDHYKSNACNEDRLQIIDYLTPHVITQGLGPQAHKLGNKKTETYFSTLHEGNYQICGKHEDPFDYYTDRSDLQLNFVTGSSSVARGKGFKLEYSELGCDRNYTSNQGRIKRRLIRENCYILITVEEGFMISLYFFEFYLAQTDNCNKSGMEIREGSDKNGKLLLRACGYADPSPVFASSNKLWIHTWLDVKGDAFGGHYDFVYTSSDKPKGCGGSFYNYMARFTSPLYPMAYTQDDQPCTWDVNVPLGMRVALKFSVFDIQGDCKYNYVKVTTYAGEDGSEHKFCKDDVPAVLYSDRHLDVYYTSSFENKGSGWMALFEAVDR